MKIIYPILIFLAVLIGVLTTYFNGGCDFETVYLTTGIFGVICGTVIILRLKNII